MKRDFTYIDHVTDSICNLIPKPLIADIEKSFSSAIKAPIFDIYNNSPVELSDFISIIEDLCETEAINKFLSMQPGDVPVTYANISKLEKKSVPLTKRA